MRELSKEIINKSLNEIQILEQKNLFYKVLNKTYKYMILHLVRTLYKMNLLKSIELNTQLFFESSIIVDLPAHSDIFLYGCKVSESDFLLQRYLNNFLNKEFIIFDIGASIGYYSLYLSKLTGKKGIIYSIDPSRKAYDILMQNTHKHDNIKALNLAIGDSDRECMINEFPTKYNEYNTLILDEFIKESKWFKKNLPLKKSISMRTIDSLVRELKVIPDVIKMDIEGSEGLLLSGMIDLIKNHQPDLIIRYWPTYRDNSCQTSVMNKLFKYGYQVYSLKNNQKICFGKLSEYKFEYILLKK